MMSLRMKFTACVAGLIGLYGCSNTDSVQPYQYSCAPLGYSAEQMLELRANQFKYEGDNLFDMAMAVTDCLKDTNPDIRDGVGYEGLTSWLRGGRLSSDQVTKIKNELLVILNADEPAQVASPFAALVLSEVARVDRVSPYLDAEARSEFVRAAADYVENVTDYRGFIDGEGWRHGIAHGADWLMQLTLNSEVSDADLGRIREAVAAQIRADGHHAYIHGEAARLARPILFIAQRGVFDEADWNSWFAELSDPAPLEDWNAAFKSEAGLAQRHNLNAFLNVIHVNASLSENENIRALLPGALESIKRVP